MMHFCGAEKYASSTARLVTAIPPENIKAAAKMPQQRVQHPNVMDAFGCFACCFIVSMFDYLVGYFLGVFSHQVGVWQIAAVCFRTHRMVSPMEDSLVELLTAETKKKEKKRRS